MAYIKVVDLDGNNNFIIYNIFLFEIIYILEYALYVIRSIWKINEFFKHSNDLGWKRATYECCRAQLDLQYYN